MTAQPVPPAGVIPCVGAIITDAAGRLLLIKRGHEPGKGLWSVPGGRVEPGETDEQALTREVLEETGLSVRPGRLIGAVRRAAPGGYVFDIRDYAATVSGGTLAAGDDADDARWAGQAELAGLPLTDGLAAALADWGVPDTHDLPSIKREGPARTCGGGRDRPRGP